MLFIYNDEVTVPTISNESIVKLSSVIVKVSPIDKSWCNRRFSSTTISLLLVGKRPSITSTLFYSYVKEETLITVSIWPILISLSTL